jgi:hypothetical protein
MRSLKDTQLEVGFTFGNYPIFFFFDSSIVFQLSAPAALPDQKYRVLEHKNDRPE